MPKVRVCATLTEEHYRALVGEAERLGVTVESLVEQTVNVLIRELEEEEESCTHDISMS